MYSLGKAWCGGLVETVGVLPMGGYKSEPPQKENDTSNCRSAVSSPVFAVDNIGDGAGILA